MSTAYGKWTPVSGLSMVGTAFQRPWCGIERTVTREAWPLGFHWKRVTVERWEYPATIDRDRLCRVLNGEPEPTPPEPKLDERLPYTLLLPHDRPYRFPTEALKAELARRETEDKQAELVRQGVAAYQPPTNSCNNATVTLKHFNALLEKRTGPANRRKATKKKGRK